MYKNIYSSPEKFDLEIVGMIEDEPNYNFDMFVVWKDKEGNLYYAEDSGCSCPSPFESYQSVQDLTRIDKNHFDAFEQAVDGFNRWYDKEALPNAADRKALIEKVRALIS